jgi:hypothetical protein
VRSQQLEVIKTLINDYDADISLTNSNDKTPKDLANMIKDNAVKTTIIGLLHKLHTSTKVNRNLEAKKDKEEERKRIMEEMDHLR